MCQPTPSLSDEEIEYVEIFKEICDGTEVSPRMRKILTWEAENLGISCERVIRIEKYIK